MLIPSRRKYKSARRLGWLGNRQIIHSLQLDCYQGHLPMKCNSVCPFHSSCWFYGLKNYKGVISHD